MTLYTYSTGEAIRELTAAEEAAYLAMVEGDTSHTGAVPGEAFGVSETVYAI